MRRLAGAAAHEIICYPAETEKQIEKEKQHAAHDIDCYPEELPQRQKEKEGEEGTSRE